MKIIQLIQKPQRRGAEIFAAQLSEQLRLTGNEVLLISIFEGDASLPFKGEWIKLNRPISNRFFDVIGWRNFAQIVKEFKADIIQANAADTLKFSVFSKKLFGWKVPIVYRNANQMGDFIRNRFHKKFNQWLLGGVSGIVSVSKASANNLHDTFGFSGNNSNVIPIGINPYEIKKGVDEKSDLELPGNFILQIGSLVEEKDPLGMLRVFREIHKYQDDLHLIYLGSGSLLGTLQKEIISLGLSDSVHVIPNQLNIFPILSKAKAIVLPSKIEGLPGVILEAMYCKVPVLAYNVGGISEVLNKKTGWLIPSGVQNAFIAAVQEVLQMNEFEKAKILDHAYKLVNENNSIEEIVKQFEQCYLKVISKNRS